MPEPNYDDALRDFDALQPGQTFILTSAHDPKPLLHRLQAERPRQFDWSVLEAGPTEYRVEVGRRAAHGARAVSEYLGWDHQRLDAILAQVTRLVREGAHQDAARPFAEFACGLNWHIDAEEMTLFPAFEEKTGMRDGPTAVLREEHRLIRLRMNEITNALRAGNVPAIERAIGALGDALDDHNIKEEQVLYPMTDRAMTDAEERDQLVNRIQVT
jgi:uncharacterized protein (DUF2249 family)/hemerythrin-like domain-containing protein